MFAHLHNRSGKHLYISPKFWVSFVVIILILTNLTIISLGESPESDGMHSRSEPSIESYEQNDLEEPEAESRKPSEAGTGFRAPGNGLRAPGSDTKSRSAMSLGFTEISTGLPPKGDFSYIALADFNKDSDIDIAFGSEDWDTQDSQGLFAFTGNGGTSWTNTTDYLWQGNSWGGLQLVDADEDGAMELYATDEDWGSKNNSGVHAWEFRNGKWTDNSAYVSTPESSGQPCNVILTNVTGDSRLDMLVNRFSGIRYYENTGGNPATWQQKSTGLPTNNWYTGAALGDINKDGLKDLVSTRNDQERMWVQSTSGNLWQE